MKQHEIKHERKLGENIFYIRPFGAFKAANLSGEVLSLLTPVLVGVVPALTESKDIFNIGSEKAASHLANSMSGVNGDKLEALLKKLLVKYENVSVQSEDETEAQLLTADIADEVFCGDAQDMFILAFDVIKVNYSGFFKKLGGQFGELINTQTKKV